MSKLGERKESYVETVQPIHDRLKTSAALNLPVRIEPAGAHGIAMMLMSMAQKLDRIEAMKGQAKEEG